MLLYPQDDALSYNDRKYKSQITESQRYLNQKKGLISLNLWQTKAKILRSLLIFELIYFLALFV